MGIKIAGRERLMLHHKFAEAQRSGNAGYLVLVYGAYHAFYGFFAVLAIGYQFGYHRVVVNGYLHALLKAIIHPNARALWGNVSLQGANIREEVIGRVLGINAQLHRVALYLQVLLFKADGLSLTRSMPVISSVTGCSTCRRVFISKK